MLTEEARQIITSFRQSGERNCVSIAIIKAGIDVFGTGGIFDCVEHANGFYVVLKDGCDFKLTSDEVTVAANSSGFQLLGTDDTSRRIMEYALLCFAVMAKRAQLEGNDSVAPGSLSFEQAIETLNDGANYAEGPRWLGLQHHVRAIGFKYRFRYSACVGASPNHCFYLSHGFEDHYGEPDIVGWVEAIKLRHLFRVCDQAEF